MHCNTEGAAKQNKKMKQPGNQTQRTTINPCSRNNNRKKPRKRIHSHGKAEMPPESGGGQNLSIHAWEEERAAAGHAATSSRDATSGSPAEKEPAAAKENKTPLGRQAEHLQSCQGGGQGSYRARIRPAVRGKVQEHRNGRGKDAQEAWTHLGN